jgi:hypothetical protein
LSRDKNLAKKKTKFLPKKNLAKKKKIFAKKNLAKKR